MSKGTVQLTLPMTYMRLTVSPPPYLHLIIFNHVLKKKKKKPLVIFFQLFGTFCLSVIYQYNLISLRGGKIFHKCAVLIIQGDGHQVPACSPIFSTNFYHFPPSPMPISSPRLEHTRTFLLRTFHALAQSVLSSLLTW